MDTVVALCLFLLLTGAAVTVGALVWILLDFPRRLGRAVVLHDLPPLPMPGGEPLTLRERRNRRRLRAQLRAALHLLPLLLPSSPALAGETSPNTGGHPMWPAAYAQTAAQELTTAGLNRQDREMVAPPTCEESLQDCRRLAVELHQEQPARWPWALAGLLVGALLFVPLGACLLWWWYVNLPGWVRAKMLWRRWPWQALRDAWRLSREVRS